MGENNQFNKIFVTLSLLSRLNPAKKGYKRLNYKRNRTFILLIYQCIYLINFHLLLQLKRA